MSPSYRATNRLRTSSDLLHARLLHQINRPTSWSDWFTAQGITAPDSVRGPRLEHIGMLMAGAIAGSGVALLPACLTERERAAGQLVMLPGRVEHRGLAYYFVIPEAKRESPRVLAFQEWILAEARAAKGPLRRVGSARA